MVRERGQNGEKPVNDQNRDLAAILANIQQRLEEQAVMMQQQSTVIQNLQQQQMNRGPGIGEIPVGGEHGHERDPQLVFTRQEPLYK